MVNPRKSPTSHTLWIVSRKVVSTSTNAALNQVYMRIRMSDISQIKSSCKSKLMVAGFLTDDVDLVQYSQHDCYYNSMMFTYLHKYKNYIAYVRMASSSYLRRLSTNWRVGKATHWYDWSKNVTVKNICKSTDTFYRKSVFSVLQEHTVI